MVSQAALHIDPAEPYHRRWPIRRGTFNRRQYKSYRDVTDDLERIWSQAIINDLKAPRREWPRYGLVLVVPDNVLPWEVKALTELAIRQMRFKSVAFLSESISGTFGVGVSSACVLDIGAQSTKICCVEDGQIISETVSNCPYGGETLTKLFDQILRLHNFPYNECDLERELDFEMMDELKIRLCTMDEEDLASAVYEAYARCPGQATRLYPFKVFEERILVPLALFEEGVPLLFQTKGDPPTPIPFYTGENDGTDLYYTRSDSTNTEPVVVEEGENLTLETDLTSAIDAPETVGTVDLHRTTKNSNLSLIEALQRALDYFDGANNPERLKKFLSSILVIGNGHKFKKIIVHLEEQLASKYPGFEIDFVLGGGSGAITGGKENLTLDAGIVSWKGGAVFAKLDCIADFFISLRDVEMGGLARAFRDRLSFSFL